MRTFLITTWLAISFSAFAFSQTGPLSGTGNISGTITSIGSGFITVENADRQQINLQVDDINQLSEIKEGDQIKASYRQEGARRIVTWLEKTQQETP